MLSLSHTNILVHQLIPLVRPCFLSCTRRLFDTKWSLEKGNWFAHRFPFCFRLYGSFIDVTQPARRARRRHTSDHVLAVPFYKRTRKCIWGGFPHQRDERSPSSSSPSPYLSLHTTYTLLFLPTTLSFAGLAFRVHPSSVKTAG